MLDGAFQQGRQRKKLKARNQPDTRGSWQVNTVWRDDCVLNLKSACSPCQRASRMPLSAYSGSCMCIFSCCNTYLRQMLGCGEGSHLWLFTWAKLWCSCGQVSTYFVPFEGLKKKNPPTDSPAIILPVFCFFFSWFLGKKESLQRGDAYSKTLKRRARGPSFASKTRTLFQKMLKDHCALELISRPEVLSSESCACKVGLWMAFRNMIWKGSHH